MCYLLQKWDRITRHALSTLQSWAQINRILISQQYRKSIEDCRPIGSTPWIQVMNLPEIALFGPSQ